MESDEEEINFWQVIMTSFFFVYTKQGHLISFRKHFWLELSLEKHGVVLIILVRGLGKPSLKKKCNICYTQVWPTYFPKSVTKNLFNFLNFLN